MSRVGRTVSIDPVPVGPTFGRMERSVVSLRPLYDLAISLDALLKTLPDQNCLLQKAVAGSQDLS